MRQEDRRLGYLYALTSAQYPGLVKIGFTTKHPIARTRELSRPTGILTPFHLAYYRDFDDCPSAEAVIHQQLDDLRVSPDREFFKMDLKEAVDVIDRLATELNGLDDSQRFSSIDVSLPPMPFSDLFATFEDRGDGVLNDDEIAQCRALEAKLS